MNDTIIVALITGGLTFAGVLVSSFSGNKKLVNQIKLEITEYHAATDKKIEALTKEVNRHNNFAERIPAVEQKLDNVEEKVNYFHKI